MASNEPQPVANKEGGGVIKCRKCRRELFLASDIIPHSEGIGQEAFSWYKRSQDTFKTNVTPPPEYISVQISEESNSEVQTKQFMLETLSKTHKLEFNQQLGGYEIRGQGLEDPGDIPNSDPLLGRNSPKLNYISASLKSSQCKSLFIEKTQWLEDMVLGSNQGKLTCPKCSGRLGSYNWAGMQCSCGKWITPAFQIHKARIDLIAYN
ncbi:Dual specificity protein phosphatase 12 isoform X4 [Oopsacas minuta]|uniref:protein-tyrosine-phosphatase n=1 Tax=Oopsacas minuta TaxID=111878 RepID=A0AAV7JCK4_9METZ|nr:Dual specificity protein phosphatase 12 isoform X4 [Oopsacas minuta]